MVEMARRLGGGPAGSSSGGDRSAPAAAGNRGPGSPAAAARTHSGGSGGGCGGQGGGGAAPPDLESDRYVGHALAACRAYLACNVVRFLRLYEGAPRMVPYLLDLLLAKLRGRAYGEPQGGAYGEPQGRACVVGERGVRGRLQGRAHGEPRGGAYGEQQGRAYGEPRGGAYGEQQGRACRGREAVKDRCGWQVEGLLEGELAAVDSDSMPNHDRNDCGCTRPSGKGPPQERCLMGRLVGAPWRRCLSHGRVAGQQFCSRQRLVCPHPAPCGSAALAPVLVHRGAWLAA